MGADKHNDPCWLCAGCGEIETQTLGSLNATVSCPECVAAELAHRDAEIERLRRERDELAARCERLREALKTYADVNHLADGISADWESCSGEPANILWPPEPIEDYPWYVEDGAIARQALQETPAPAEPAPAAPEAFIEFVYIHQKSGEKRFVKVSREHIIDEAPCLLEDLLSEQICNCEPIGETNVLECNCGDYIDGFELQDTQPAGQEVDDA